MLIVPKTRDSSCERERERERECMCVCMCVCVCERERERERERESTVCVCVCHKDIVHRPQLLKGEESRSGIKLLVYKKLYTEHCMCYILTVGAVTRTCTVIQDIRYKTTLLIHYGNYTVCRKMCYIIRHCMNDTCSQITVQNTVNSHKQLPPSQTKNWHVCLELQLY